MKPWLSAVLLAMLLPVGPAKAQDSGAAVSDADGGGIVGGRPARCRLGIAPAQPCTFVPRNGDGSFTIHVAKHAYYADKVAANAVVVEYFNGARMVPQGRYVRDRRDPACWVGGGAGQRLCVEAVR